MWLPAFCRRNATCQSSGDAMDRWPDVLDTHTHVSKLHMWDTLFEQSKVTWGWTPMQMSIICMAIKHYILAFMPLSDEALLTYLQVLCNLWDSTAKWKYLEYMFRNRCTCCCWSVANEHEWVLKWAKHMLIFTLFGFQTTSSGALLGSKGKNSCSHFRRQLSNFDPNLHIETDPPQNAILN